MNSINEEVNNLHQCYCVSLGIGDMPLMATWERQWLSAVNAGVTCADVPLFS